MSDTYYQDYLDQLDRAQSALRQAIRELERSELQDIWERRETMVQVLVILQKLDDES